MDMTRLYGLPRTRRPLPMAEGAGRASLGRGDHHTISEQLGQRAPVRGIDVDGDAHAGAQDRIVRLAVDADAHRDALDYLDPIAARVLRRQDRELGAARRADALDGAGPYPARVGIDEDPDRIAGFHMSEVGFLDVGVDPHVVGRDE